MPSVEVSAPVSSVASDWLALGVSWVRPGAGSIGGALTPSFCCCWSGMCGCACFEGNDE
jgi:hypothetical protein